ncbi:MAG: GNAT family N-acetyltransferase [Alphaproteobacteria bacterium]|nr:GNAT family N-acetyltransferase [Alphaproteobacteria bacterium]MCB9795313.1 GNAT family N-acetyltransferase [Alphaproteobacteria bacterium]
MEDELNIRALSPDEGSLLKELRLTALSDTPDAFGETLGEASQRDSAWWGRLTETLTGLGPHVAFVAERGEQTVGLIFGIADKKPEVARAGGLWVSPVARRGGVGRALLQAVLDWAEETGRSEVALWVPEQGDGARALYASMGFAATEARRHVREGMTAVEMRRALS